MRNLLAALCATTAMILPIQAFAQQELGKVRSAADVLLEAQPPALRQDAEQILIDDALSGRQPDISKMLPPEAMQQMGISSLPNLQKKDYSLKEEYLSLGTKVEIFASDNVKLEGTIYQQSGINGPGIVYLHGDTGLKHQDHLRAAQLASKGFTVIVPDLYRGITPKTDIEKTALVESTLKNGRYLQDWYFYLQSQIAPIDKIGVVGFEMGGQLAMRLSVLGGANVTVLFYPDLNLENLAPFFGGVQGPVLAHYAQFDPRISQAEPELFKRLLFKKRKSAEIRVWPNVNYGFADLDHPQYDKFWADLTWARANVYFREYLQKRDY